MHAPSSAAETIDVDVYVDPAADPNFRINPADHPDLDNVVLSPCGKCIESFDHNGHHVVIDWDELVGEEDEEEIPHEQVMEEMRLYCEELEARRMAER
jgi:hypothetical protein